MRTDIAWLLRTGRVDDPDCQELYCATYATQGSVCLRSMYPHRLRWVGHAELRFKAGNDSQNTILSATQ